ncbi:hypothetical protein MKX08_000151 [Trichoderma sp. CBMAI-0020]|nr:hypothetical protein MKX08_000151 [Trichoderma sp. CBMAI-0020]
MHWIQFAALIITASAETVAGRVSPLDGAASTCHESYNGKFEVSINKLGKRDIEKQSSCGSPDALLLTLHDGILKDAKDRTGCIASNYQFQFDEPPQVDAIYTKGFSVCENGTLALHSSTTFYQCRSGDFYNLYDRNWAPQCEAIELRILPCDGHTGGGGHGREETTIGSKVVKTAVVTATADGQPQVHTTTIAIPICQIGDGQVQGHTTPCGGQSPASPISQISDGQVFHQPPPTNPPAVMPTATGALKSPGTPVTQLPDGQPQGPGPKAPPAGTGTLPKPPPSASSEAPVNDAAQLFSNVKMTIGILMFCNMLIGV